MLRRAGAERLHLNKTMWVRGKFLNNCLFEKEYNQMKGKDSCQQDGLS